VVSHLCCLFRWLCHAPHRVAFAVLALLLGLVPQVHAGPPLIAPAVEVQAPDLQPAPFVRVYFLAYRSLAN
jgi:hypothetical protein